MLSFRTGLSYFITFVTVIFIFVTTLKSQTGFTDVTQSAGIYHEYIAPGLMGSGSAFFDFDNDGDLDIYITAGRDRDGLYRNEGDGTFIDVAEQAGLADTDSVWTIGVAIGDIDNDGFRDLFVTANHLPSLLYRNKGDGTFENISTTAGIVDSALGFSATFGDFNLDGFLDIYVGNYVDIFRILADEETGDRCNKM